MEKKTKKLQLRKETIAVLNGERMTYVVGGNNNPCQNGGIFADGMCICPPDFYGQHCEIPGDMGTSQNGEICQDTVGSFSDCRPTCKGNTCPINYCKR